MSPGVCVWRTGCRFAAAAALVSSLSGLSLAADSVYFGEIALSGDPAVAHGLCGLRKRRN
jgi:DNA repair protein RadA/Sms